MLIHSYVVRCLALAVLRQHVAVALALTLVALLTSLTGLQRGVGVTACMARRACLPSARRVSEACPRRSISGRDKVARASVRISTVRAQIRAAASPQNGQEAMHRGATSGQTRGPKIEQRCVKSDRKPNDVAATY